MRLTNENLIRIILLIIRKLSFINGKNGKQKKVPSQIRNGILTCKKCKISIGNRADA